MISVTMLSSYMFCPRKLYIERVLKISKPPKESMVIGTVRHHAFDAINKEEENLVKSITKSDGFTSIQRKYRLRYFEILKETVKRNRKGIKSVNQTLVETFNKNWSYIEDESKNRAKLVSDFKDKTGYFGDLLWSNFTPKISSEKRIFAASLGLNGIIDQIEVHEDGTQIPVELKTGRMPKEGVWPGHKFQIGAYILMLGDKIKKSIEYGYVRYMDYGENKKVHMNPFLRDEILETRDRTNVLLKAKEIPKYTEDKSKCISCELREKCYSL